jgi:hypothetical protein
MKKIEYHFFGTDNSIVKSLLDRNNIVNMHFYNRVEIEKIAREDDWEALQFDTKSFNVVLYSWGLLFPNRIVDQKFEEKIAGYIYNFLIPVTLIEKLNKFESGFNFIYISSESAKKGSFDGNYACQKAATETFIRECQLLNRESIVVAVAPSMMSDAGMTLRRSDTKNVENAKNNHPKGNLLRTAELVKLIEFLVFKNTYISNTTIEINGGKFARMQYK